MKKSDDKAFTEFMLSEAEKYGRAITPYEIATWFENFPRSTLEDFKSAWNMHKVDAKDGKFFPRIVDLQRLLKSTGTNPHDRRCAVMHSVTTTRCNYFGTISMEGRRAICRAHYRLFSVPHEPAESDAIIENSKTRDVMEVFNELAARALQPNPDGPPLRRRLSDEEIRARIDEAVIEDQGRHEELLEKINAHMEGSRA